MGVATDWRRHKLVRLLPSFLEEREGMDYYISNIDLRASGLFVWPEEIIPGGSNENENPRGIRIHNSPPPSPFTAVALITQRQIIMQVS